MNNKDFSYVLKLLKESLIKKLSKEIDYRNIEKIKYLKWCYDKLLLNDNNTKTSILKPGSICWVDFGQNIGSELRKLRPTILWRSSKIESMANFSYKRLREPFFRNKKIAHLTQDDYSNILISLKKYYTFEN